jgi:hypothetical protein
VGTRSLAKSIIAKNSGKVSIVLINAQVTGDFALSRRCSSPLRAGSRCIYAVVFAPTAKGLRPGLLTIDNNGSTGPRTVTLTGTGR